MLKTSPKQVTKRVIVMPSAKNDLKIVAAAKADPDAAPMTQSQLEGLVPLRAVHGTPRSR
jgi:hypothetical protein